MQNKKTQLITKTLSNFLKSGGDLKQVKQVVENLDSLVKNQQQQHVANIYSCVDLTKEQKQKIESELKRVTNKSLDFKYQIDQELLGGLKIRIGDLILDYSLQGNFDRLLTFLKG